jgi:hypothetical protein
MTEAKADPALPQVPLGPSCPVGSAHPSFLLLCIANDDF